MAYSKDDIRVLLLQIRNDTETIEEEFKEFVYHSALNTNQITVVNSFAMNGDEEALMAQHDVLMIGGSSDVSVLRPDIFPFLPACQGLIRYCYESNIPVFASCFGFQLMVQEFGGQVIVDPEQMEMGTYEVHLTEEAKQDPLMAAGPDPFWVVSGHQERAYTIPENATTLAYTPLCPYHIIKIHDKPMYGFQFHPEVDTQDLVTRITRYQQKYIANDPERLERIKANATQDTSYANHLVARFLDQFVLNKNFSKQVV